MPTLAQDPTYRSHVTLANRLAKELVCSCRRVPSFVQGCRSQQRPPTKSPTWAFLIDSLETIQPALRFYLRKRDFEKIPANSKPCNGKKKKKKDFQKRSRLSAQQQTHSEQNPTTQTTRNKIDWFNKGAFVGEFLRVRRAAQSPCQVHAMAGKLSLADVVFFLALCA